MSQIKQLTDIRNLQMQHDQTLAGKKTDSGFAQLFENAKKKNEGVQFSKHATERISQRGMEITEGLLDSLNQGVEKARMKGSKDTVIISTQGAFVVNVPNNIVITTMTEQEMKENIFTNIDSAVLV